jgi:UDP-N-acetylmuramoylalanine--D-glutamate ligase
VREAAALARPGDAVLLSPACASFDWYPDGGYPARGDDFRRHVAALTPTSLTTDKAPTR